MNAERLHEIVKALKSEMEDRATLSLFGTFLNGLRSLVAQSNAVNQQNLASYLDALYGALNNSRIDEFSPGWRQILKEIGGEEFFGIRLKQKIEITLARNQITPAVALDEFQQLRERMEFFYMALKGADSAFDIFGIGEQGLPPGECEVGILIPRDAVENQLVPFSNELKELSFALNTFSEVATGHPDSLAIRTISSSDLLVYLQAGAPYAACVAVAIERVVALYKQLLEIRKLQAEIQKQGVPDSITKGMEDHANKVMENGIEKISVEMVEQFHTGRDKGRKHELIIAVQISLNRIANRIDRGYNFEVRAEPVPDDGENEELHKAIAAVQKASVNLQFLKLEGRRILSLPEEQEKPKKKGQSGHKEPNE